MQDGTLERILRKWQVWNDDQPPLQAQVLAGEPIRAGRWPRHERRSVAACRAGRRRGAICPRCCARRSVTIVLSCLSMALAVALGVLIASGRVYGTPLARALLTGYVELDARHADSAAAVRALLRPRRGDASAGVRRGVSRTGAELRGVRKRDLPLALEAVGRGQLEAARTLGFTEWQALRLIRGPQAFRLALAPMTNDFVALLKDSSLVSVLTVVELTKQTQIFATNLGSWVLPGALCAALYLAMSLPLSALARRLEAAMEAADGMTRRVVRRRSTSSCAAACAPCSTASSFDVRPRRDRGADGRLGIGQDDDPARDRRARAVRTAARSTSTASRSAAGAAVARQSLRALRAQGRHGVPVPLPLRAPVSASKTSGSRRSTCIAPGQPRRSARARPAAAARRRAPGTGAAARALGRRGAAGRHRPRARHRSAAAADGRADRVTGPRAARRACPLVKGAGRRAAARW